MVHFGGAWVAQSVERLTWAQVMISWFVSSSPASGSVPTARSLGPGFGFCVSLSLCPTPTRALSLSLSQKSTLKRILRRVAVFLKTPLSFPFSLAICLLKRLGPHPAACLPCVFDVSFCPSGLDPAQGQVW